MIFRLHSRLVVWNLLIIGLTVGILGNYLSSALRDHIETEIELRLTEEAGLAGAFLAHEDTGGNQDELADRLGGLLDLRVTIIAHDGTVLGDSDLDRTELQGVENHRSRPEVIDAEEQGTGTAIRWSPTVRVEFIYVARRFDPYVVRLAMPLSAVETLMADLRSRLIFAMGIAIGLTLIFGILIRGLISRPLREISQASTKLAGGDLSQRLPISGDEEIAALGNSLNTMAKNLSTQMRALTDEKQRLESIVGAMTEGVMVLDRTGSVFLANRAMPGLLGTERDLIGRTPLEVFRDPGIDDAVRRVLRAEPAQVVEFATGNARILQANVAAVVDASGAVDAVVMVFHDLTEIRNTERMRRDFVANVSHEFKTPLTSIRGYAETLLSGALQDPGIAGEFVRIIERNAQHLENLVSDLLTLARMESEPLVSKESVNIKNILDEQIASRTSIIAGRQITVANECADVEIRADKTRLSMAVSNLIDNAVYYNRTGGEIRIACRIVADSVELSIADTGQGIASDELPRIFERFYRVDRARSREPGRTGLGLSIVKHAIESQGGSVTVASRLGAGSTFTIRLPIVTA